MDKFKIGFEFEVISKSGFDTVKKDLKKVLGKASLFWLDDDYSIRPGRYDEGIEIITAPQSPKVAFKVFDSIKKYMVDTGKKTNVSTGLHINISNGSRSDMRKLNPEMIVAMADDHYISSRYNRSTNKFCVPWKTHVRNLNTEVNKFNNRKSSYRVFDLNSEFKEMVSLLYDEEHLVNAYRPAEAMCKRIGHGKYSSINITKLKYLGYVEYRMLGGKDYHLDSDSVTVATEHFMLGQSLAKRYDSKRIETYLEWCKNET